MSSLTALKLYHFVSLLKSAATGKEEAASTQVGTEITHRSQKSHLMTHPFPVIPSTDWLTDADALHILPHHLQSKPSDDATCIKLSLTYESYV